MTEDQRQPQKYHFDRKPVRKAEFIMPPNTLKAKVGSGGLSDEILTKAQSLLENNAVDFMPLADMYLGSLSRAIDAAKDMNADALSHDDSEALITAMLYPAMQLKANGGMFRYQMVTKISDRLIQYLEVIRKPDLDALEIVMAFHATIRAVVMGRITGDGGRHGVELARALDDACARYFERNPEVNDDLDHDYIHSV
jgi:hypothetical protein